MILFIYGVNSKTIPKEKILSLVSDYEEIFRLFTLEFERLKNDFKGLGASVISTCQRFEILIALSGLDGGEEKESAAAIRQRLAKYFKSILRKHEINFKSGDFFYSASEHALKHLFGVVCGFESEDIGEIQVLGQVKDSYKRSCEASLVCGAINKIYGEALKCAIKVRNKVPVFTDRNKIRNNLLKMLHERIGDENISGKRALIIGGGGAGRLAEALRLPGIKVRLVKNPSSLKKEIFKDYDILIFDAADIDFRVNASELSRYNKSQIVVDMSISRNVSVESAALENIELITIENLISSNWKEGENLKKRSENKNFYECAENIVKQSAGEAFECLEFEFGNGRAMDLMKEIAASIEKEFARSARAIEAGKDLKILEGLKRALIKKIPSLIKRRYMKKLMY